ncbi:MAG: hypothetical protein J07HN4v3_01403 [Halonotius sp. J07HN4]|nr:MAG: hypothetical protein J07HN4v3_01403 [Halonotius sp. J07HN4]
MQGAYLARNIYRFDQIGQLGGRIYACRLCGISCMPEEVLFKSENKQSREEIASYLRQVADNLDSGAAINLKAGSESVTLTPPSRPTFEVKAEREGPAGNMTERSVEFELEWDENDGEEGGEGGQLEIE